ncbi:MAG: ABC transporter ATP-binding protein [Myxococcota bacterium]
MLEARSLEKSYGSLRAVADVSLRVGAGESVGLLGPNGAGKTTTISILTGLLKPDRGQVLIEGKEIQSDVDPIKRKLGLVPQELALYEELRAEENLRIFGALYGLEGSALDKAIDAALELVKLRDRRRDPVKDFSGGMKRRINLAAALLHAPSLIILDEPTVGVDPQSRNAIFENIEALKAGGCAVLYTTHYMEEAERLCDRIVIVDRGAVIADDSLRGLYGRLPAQNRLRLELAGPVPAGLTDALGPACGVLGIKLEAEGVLELELETAERISSVLAAISASGATVRHLETVRPSLEMVFLSLTGKSLRDP